MGIPTNQNALIGDLRRALGSLERPSDGEDITLYIGDHELNFTAEHLDAPYIDPDDEYASDSVHGLQANE